MGGINTDMYFHPGWKTIVKVLAGWVFWGIVKKSSVPAFSLPGL